ncbi:putative signal transducing protein [Planctomicrobium sp. SH664]|uniref:putative signal transducing protein n=1 Tax=Planctomicrobium sp. SH664 TaxID=3448125 RepID=UPI003F5B637C
MDADELVAVYETTDVMRAELIRASLDGEGISAFVDNESQAGLSGVLQVHVMVRAADEKVASAYIAELESGIHRSDVED